MIVYLSGPMTGLKDFNRPAFFKAAKSLLLAGLRVFNPAENGLPPSAPWDEHMRVDIKALMDCRAIALLPGWESSKGANIELRLALDLGMRVYDATVLVRLAEQAKAGQARSLHEIVSREAVVPGLVMNASPREPAAVAQSGGVATIEED